MAKYLLFIGLFVIIITGKLTKDWASGIAGFLYGGIIILFIYLLVILVSKFIQN